MASHHCMQAHTRTAAVHASVPPSPVHEQPYVAMRACLASLDACTGTPLTCHPNAHASPFQMHAPAHPIRYTSTRLPACNTPLTGSPQLPICMHLAARCHRALNEHPKIAFFFRNSVKGERLANARSSASTTPTRSSWRRGDRGPTAPTCRAGLHWFPGMPGH